MLAEEDQEKQRENVRKYSYEIVVSRRHSELLDKDLHAVNKSAPARNAPAKAKNDFLFIFLPPCSSFEIILYQSGLVNQVNTYKYIGY